MIQLTSWLSAANLARLLLGLGQFAILTRWLGVSHYGELMYVLTIVAIADSVSLAGLDTVVTRDVAAQPRRDGALFGAVLGVRTVLSMAAGAVVWVVAGPWAALLVLAHVGQVGVAILRAKLLRGPQIAASLLYPLLSLVTVAMLWQSREPSVALVLAALALTCTVAAGGQLMLARRNLRCALSWSAQLARNMLQVSWPFWLVGLTVAALYRLDVLMLQWLLGAEVGARAIGLYQAAYRLIEGGQFLLGALVMVAFPVMSAAGGESRAKLRKVYRNALKGALAMGGIACVLAFALGGWAVRLLAGEAYGPSVLALYLLAPALIVVLINSLSASLLTVVHRPFTLLKITTTALVVNGLLNLWVIPRWGFAGAAAATTAAETVGMCFLLWHTRNLLKTGKDK